MGQFAVDPGSLESASTVLRRAQGVGMTTLAQAIVDDLNDGEQPAGSTELGSSLPRLVTELTDAAAAVSHQLTFAAAHYRGTEWLVRVALAGQR